MKFLIAGLGNIGEEYHNTRHNVGFRILDSLAEKKEVSFSLDRHSFYANYKFKGRQIHMIKPTTYMNLSGKAIRFWLQKLDVSTENLLVLVDDMALPFGKLRLRAKGGDAGHNGLKDIIAILGNSKFPRLRFGIGDEFHKGQQVDFVLGKWSAEEENQLPPLIDRCHQVIHSFATIGIGRTMTDFNRKQEQ